jgi:peptidoglycan L-alanyl-D-glutamate endopeptidase CwlK
MAKFSKSSADKLAQCHPDLQLVMNEAIKEYDFTVLFGHRTPIEQLSLFKKGRTFVNNAWVKIGKTVTDKDGYVRKSKHNYKPSLAVDVAPYPINWSNIARFVELKEVVFRCAERLGIKLVWGADWDGDGNIREHSLQDYPHYEVKG